MIQEIGKDYDNHFEPLQPGPLDYVLHYSDRRALVRTIGERDGVTTIDLPHLADYPVEPSRIVFAFRIGGAPFFIALDEDVAVPPALSYEPLRWVRHTDPADLLFAAVTGAQLFSWYDNNRFCPHCGHRTRLAPASREVVCPECALVTYPKICPGVIAGITNGDSLVMTKYARGEVIMYALVAGFCEVGESVEDTLRREVMEEVGLRVRNIRFYKSQPWSFSDSLLMGFWCEVDGDPTITVDGTELKEAVWMTREEMPSERESDRASLTGEMIERFRHLGHRVFDDWA